MTNRASLPVGIIGAGPVGLAAAAHLVERGIDPVVLERGGAAGAAVAEWGHVRMFSPWEFNVDAAARRLLESNGWQMPAADHLPTGAELIRDYLAPLAMHPAIAPHIRYHAEAVALTRLDRSRLSSDRREDAPFVIVWWDPQGRQTRSLVRAVIDASGTSVRPNPIGEDGLPVTGEAAHAARIAYGIPDVLRTARASYENGRILVIVAGHSAINPAVDAPVALATLIDPNLHSWGSVRSHGARELGHPERDFYIAGMKSYGRAPTFLLATGHEQVRSIVAELAGDHRAAREVHLVLSETGVCRGEPVATQKATGCCGGPAISDADACCVLDEQAKAAGQDRCDCKREPALDTAA